jgi:hypothetical protein
VRTLGIAQKVRNSLDLGIERNRLALWNAGNVPRERDEQIAVVERRFERRDVAPKTAPRAFHERSQDDVAIERQETAG